MGDITAANAVYMLSIANVFPSPQQLQGWATDDMFATEPLEQIETLMGVDGILSAGFVYVAVNQDIMLQADSASNDIFDQWASIQVQNRQVFEATGVVTLVSLGKKWFMTAGKLVRYHPMPTAKKILQPRRYGIRWQSVSVALA